MARLMSRATHTTISTTFPKPPTSRYTASFSPTHFRVINQPLKMSPIFVNGGRFAVFCGGFGGGEKGYKKVTKVPFNVKKKKVNDLELSVEVLVEEGLPNDPHISSIAEMLQLNAPTAMKLAFEGLKDSKHKTRDTSIKDVVGGFETVELSLLLCNDEFIQALNKQWRGEDHATDVLSMSQHIPGLKTPILMLGDVVISVETAARQAEERGHTLLDEIRILLVHGLLHLLGFDHELSDEAEEEMQKEEESLLKNLGWKGKGLIKSAYDTENDDRKKAGTPQLYRPKFKYIFCDMDGTLLNSKSEVSSGNVNAIKEAMSRGVQFVIATGKARPAAMDVLKRVDLVGKDGILSDSLPGVFLQGLLVYGQQGREIFRKSLDPNFCKEAFLYSLEHRVPLVAFCSDICLTLFDHPLVDDLHQTYHEPKAQIMNSAEELVASAEIQKMIFLDTPEQITTTLRPYWSEVAADNAAGVVQALPNLLELVPVGTSKGNGVKLLIDHLGVTPDEIMAIGDGENDIEMLKLAKLGVAVSNATEKVKAVADVIGISNDEDGVAEAIYQYAF